MVSAELEDPTPQGRKWLTKTGWASSNLARHCRPAAARRRLLFCPKLGGQLPTLPTRHLRPCTSIHTLKVIVFCLFKLGLLQKFYFIT